MTGFHSIAAIVAALHVAALSFGFGLWHWKYLLLTLVSGATLWGVLPLMPLRRWQGLAIVAALAVQQAAFWLWDDTLRPLPRTAYCSRRND